MGITEVRNHMTDMCNRDLPKMPTHVVDMYGIRRGNCPNCGKYVFSGDKFCRECGQRLNRKYETTRSEE